MSDIPIGSPPAPPGRHAAPSGWYPDPVNQVNERYWDGWQWTKNVREREVPGQRPVWPPAQAYAPPPQQPGQPGPQPPNPYQQAQPPYQQNPYQQQHPYPSGYAPAGYPTQQPTTADGVPLAGWWWRFLAVVIDAIVVSMVSSVVTLPWQARLNALFGGWAEELVVALQTGSPPPDLAPLLVSPVVVTVVLIGFLLALAYHIVMLRFLRATVGKLALGLRVVPADRGRSTGPLPWGTVALRSVSWLLPSGSGPTALVPLVGFVLLVFHAVDALFAVRLPRRQAIHDVAARTQVVKIR